MSPGRDIGGHTLRSVMGEGPFGVVWEAEDRSGQTVALKLLRSSFAQRPEGKAAFQRLRQAARAHAKVQHPYVASVLDLVDEPEEAALGAVCSHHEGFPLGQLEVSTAARRGDDPTELSRLLFFFEELGDALHWLHERGVVHGNLKPSNVLVQRGDFGIIPKILDLSWSAIGVAASPENVFISPEQFAGRVPAHASDQWAFGTLLETTVGVDGAPRGLVEAVQRMRARAPSQRFSNMKEAVDALRSVRSELERARVLSRSSRFRAQQEGHQPPVPSSRSLGEHDSGDISQQTVQGLSAVDERLRASSGRSKEASPLRLAPAAMSRRDLEAAEPPSVHGHRLKPRTPIYLGLGAALVGGALLLAVISRSGSTVTAEATAGAQEVSAAAAPSSERKGRPDDDSPSLKSPEETTAAEATETAETPAPVDRERSRPAAPKEAQSETEAAKPAPPRPAEDEPREAAPPPTPAAPAAPKPDEAPSASDCALGSASDCAEAAAWYAARGRDREARDAYEAACDGGRRAACVEAIQWWAGSGRPEADKKTFILLTKACALDGAQACHLASERVAAGRGVPADPERASRLRARACHLGRTASCAESPAAAN